MQYEANLSGSGVTISGGAAFGAPGVPQISVGPGNNPNFTDYLDFGDGIGNFVPSGDAYVGNVQHIGNPLAATIEKALLLSGTALTDGAALGMTVADHLLSNYANDLGVTLPQSQNQSSYGAAEIVDFINTFGIVPFGGTGSAPTSSPVDQNGTLLIGGDTLSVNGGTVTVTIGNNDPAEILTGSGQTATAGTGGIDALIGAGTDNTLSAGSASQAILIGEGTGATLLGGSDQNELYALGNNGTVDGGSGANQIFLAGTVAS